MPKTPALAVLSAKNSRPAAPSPPLPLLQGPRDATSSTEPSPAQPEQASPSLSPIRVATVGQTVTCLKAGPRPTPVSPGPRALFKSLPCGPARRSRS